MNRQFDLERAALGELDAASLAALREQLRQEGRNLDEEIIALQEDAARLFDRHPPGAFARRVHQRAAQVQKPQRAPRLSMWMGGGALACAAAAALFLVPSAQQQTENPPTVRAKGEVLQLWILDANGKSLDDGAAVFAGDSLRVRLRGEEGRYVAVASVDGTGAITHHPTGASTSKLTTSTAHQLPIQYTLDDAPHFERFVLIQSESPLSREAVERAITDKVWPADWRVVEKALTKATRR